MADLNAFIAFPGSRQLRIERAVTLTNTEVLLVLGHEQPGHVAELEATPGRGDHIEITQEADLTGFNLIRVTGSLEVRSQPAGVVWMASVVIDGDVLASLRGRPGGTRSLEDLVGVVQSFNGLHRVGVRLELVEV